MVNGKLQMVNGSDKGFTLIEMLIVFALTGTLTVAGVISFFSYSQNQAFRTSVSEVTHLLNTAKTRAISQVKPTDCGTQVLRGYQVSFTVPGSTYVLQAVCDANTYPLQTKTLPTNVSFEAGSATVVLFPVRTGIVSQQQVVTVTVTNGTSKTVTVDTSGNITQE